MLLFICGVVVGIIVTVLVLNIEREEPEKCLNCEVLESMLENNGKGN